MEPHTHKEKRRKGAQQTNILQTNNRLQFRCRSAPISLSNFSFIHHRRRGRLENVTSIPFTSILITLIIILSLSLPSSLFPVLLSSQPSSEILFPLFLFTSALPTILSIHPSDIIPPSQFMTLTLEGREFGMTQAEVREDIQLVEVANDGDAASSSTAYPCLNTLWLNSTHLSCSPPLYLPANHYFAFRVNISTTGVSVIPRFITDASVGSLLKVDCYASNLCSSCYLTPPPDSKLNPTSTTETRIYGMNESTILIVFVIGAVCTLLFLLGSASFLLTLYRRRVASQRKVGQQQHGSGRSEKAGNVVMGNSNGFNETAHGGDDADDEIAVPKGVMISYSHANTAFALELEAALTKEGFEVWIDTKITPGEDWRANIAQAIELSFAVVVILSPTSVTSRYCREEVYYAAQTRRAVFPIVHQDCWAHLKGGLKMLLQRIQWLNFARDSWATCFPKLVHNLKAARESQLTLARNEAKLKKKAVQSYSRTGVYSFTTKNTNHLDVVDPNEEYDLDEDEDGLASGDTSDEDTIDTQPAAVVFNKRSSYHWDLQAVAAGTPMIPKPTPRSSGEHKNLKSPNSSHTATTPTTTTTTVTSDQPTITAPSTDDPPIEPVDVYICFDSTSKYDLLVATVVRDYLRDHGLKTYMSQRPQARSLAQRNRNRLNGDDGRASPGLFGEDGAFGGYHSRRPSVQVESFAPFELENGLLNSHRSAQTGSYRGRFVRDPSFQPDPASFAGGGQSSLGGTNLAVGAGNGGMFASSFAAHAAGISSMNESYDSMASLRRARHANINAPSIAMDESIEDCFEANAKHIDSSNMMIFISSAVSFKSPDCADELHYAYELSVPLFQVRLDIPGLHFHDGLLKGSVGMMLQRTPSVHWDVDGQGFVELCSHYHALKHRLAAERQRKKAEIARSRRRTLKLLAHHGNQPAASPASKQEHETNKHITEAPMAQLMPQIMRTSPSQQYKGLNNNINNNAKPRYYPNLPFQSQPQPTVSPTSNRPTPPLYIPHSNSTQCAQSSDGVSHLDTSLSNSSALPAGPFHSTGTLSQQPSLTALSYSHSNSPQSRPLIGDVSNISPRLGPSAPQHRQLHARGPSSLHIRMPSSRVPTNNTLNNTSNFTVNAALHMRSNSSGLIEPPLPLSLPSPQPHRANTDSSELHQLLQPTPVGPLDVIPPSPSPPSLPTSTSPILVDIDSPHTPEFLPVIHEAPAVPTISPILPIAPTLPPSPSQMHTHTPITASPLSPSVAPPSQTSRTPSLKRKITFTIKRAQ